MNKILKYIVCLTLILPIITGCQALKDGLEGNKKTKRAEEFLIKKKDPLVLPPEYEKLPLPNTKEENKKSAIETVLNSSKKESDSKSTSVLENMILKELRNKR